MAGKQLSTLYSNVAGLPAATMLGNNTAGVADAIALTPAQIQALALVYSSSTMDTLLAGKADLVSGLVPASQLPSYVDDVIEAANLAALSGTGETGKIYVTLDTNQTYRWSGSVYVLITDSTAVWGSISGTLASQTDLTTALALKAALVSPTFSGIPAAPTAAGGTNTTQIATTAFVTTAVAAVDLTGYVPYTGATTNLNLGTRAITAVGAITVNGVGSDGSGDCDVKINGSGGVGSGISLVSTGGGGTFSLISRAIGTFGVYDKTAGRYPLVLSGSDYQTVIATSSHAIGAGLKLAAEAAGGSEYILLSNANGSGAGGGSFSLFDVANGVHRITVSSGGVTTFAGAITTRNGTSPTSIYAHNTYTSTTSYGRLGIIANAGQTAYEIASEKGSAGGANLPINLGHRDAAGVFTSALSIGTTGAATFAGALSADYFTFSTGGYSGTFLSHSGNSAYIRSVATIDIKSVSYSDTLTIDCGSGTTPFARIVGYTNNAKAQLGLYTKSGQTVASLLFGDSTITTLVGLDANAAGILEINNGTKGTFADLKCAAITASGNVTGTKFVAAFGQSLPYTSVDHYAGLYITRVISGVGLTTEADLHTLRGLGGASTAEVNISGTLSVSGTGGTVTAFGVTTRNGTSPTAVYAHNTYTSATSYGRLGIIANAGQTAYEIASEKGSAGGANLPINLGHRDAAGVFTSALTFPIAGGAESIVSSSTPNFVMGVTGVTAKSTFRTVSSGGSYGQFFIGANESSEAVRFDTSVPSIGFTFDNRASASQVNVHYYTAAGASTYPIVFQCLGVGSVAPGIGLLSGGRFGWSSYSTAAYLDSDTTIGRESAGVVAIYTAGSGTTKGSLSCAAITASDGITQSTTASKFSQSITGWNAASYFQSDTTGVGNECWFKLYVNPDFTATTLRNVFAIDSYGSISNPAYDVIRFGRGIYGQTVQIQGVWSSLTSYQALDLRSTASACEISSAKGSAGGANLPINLGHRSAAGVFSAAISIEIDGSLSSTRGITGCEIFGSTAGRGATMSGQYNSLFGIGAGYFITTGANNSAFGGFANYTNASGSSNSGFGYAANYSVNGGSRNSSVGHGAVYNNQNGNNNTGVGYYALLTTLGTGSTAIGAYAGKYETGSNAFYVDNQDRVNTAGDKAGAILYGVFNATPSSQTLVVNASTTVNGTITASGNLSLSTVGKFIQYKSGTGQRAGNATLVAGTVTVTNTTVTADTVIMLARKTSGGTIGTAVTYTVSAGASFTITSDNILDTSVFSYELIEVV